jgi:hypothetical protein
MTESDCGVVSRVSAIVLIGYVRKRLRGGCEAVAGCFVGLKMLVRLKKLPVRAQKHHEKG